jgi:glycerol-3-phosphate dehydrogenase (NAD(P)+)
MATFAIVGAGMMGTAMCWPFSDNGQQVRLIGTPLDEDIIESIKNNRFHPKLARKIPEDVIPFSSADIERALKGVDGVIGGISSFGVDWFGDVISAFVDPGVPVLSVTKGLEDQPSGDLLTFPEVLDQKMPVEKSGKMSFNAIGGPCIAHELAARRQTSVVFTGKELKTLEFFKENLSTPYYHIWCSTDYIEVETCAALKNAYAMGVGMAIGMMEKFGPDGLANLYNPQAAIFGQGCYEMSKFLEIMQGDQQHVAWLPGAGDLFVTVFGGRTVRLGKLLGQDVPFVEARKTLAGVTLESVEIIKRVCTALPMLEERGLTSIDHFPLMTHMGEIILEGAEVDIPWHRFFDQYKS